MTKNVLLPTHQLADWHTFIIQKRFRKAGAPLTQLDKDSKIFIIPSKSAYNKLGKANAVVVVCSGISIHENPEPTKASIGTAGDKYYWNYEYRFTKTETILFSELVKILGKNPFYGAWSGHPMYC